MFGSRFACAQTYLDWRTLMKEHPPKYCSVLVWIARWRNSLLTRSCNPKNNLCLYKISYKSHLTLHINVQSGQISMSVVPLDRKINCILGFVSLLNIFGTQSSEQFHAKKYKSNLLHVRFACAQSILFHRCQTKVRVSVSIPLIFHHYLPSRDLTQESLTERLQPWKGGC
jgi:hypothetical protein